MTNSIHTKEINILNGSLLPSIIKFTIPIALSNILQQLFNAVDTTVVGRFAGSDALAAVGSNSELVALIVNISSGLAIGSNVLIAKFIGENRRKKIPKAIYTSILLAGIIGLIGLIIGLLFSDHILHTLNTPTAVFKEALIYLKIYLIGYPFLVIYDFCSAILRGHGDSRRPFIVLIISGIINLVLNLIFVIVFHMGVSGVAIATDISNMFSCFALLIIVFAKDKHHLEIKNIAISLDYIKKILIIGIPAAIQIAVFCFANLFITASVNSFGKIATSGSTISINFEYFSYYIVTAFGQTATTFISQNYASKNIKRCKAILKHCIILGIIFTACTTVPLVMFSHFFASIFSNDSKVIEMASIRIIIVLAIEPLCAIYEVLAGVLRGRGYSLQPAITTMIGICATRIIWIIFIFDHIHTLNSLFIIYPISWIITNVFMIITYKLLI